MTPWKGVRRRDYPANGTRRPHGLGSGARRARVAMFAARRLPDFARRIRVHQHDPHADDHVGPGGVRHWILLHSTHRVASAGTSRIPASPMPTRARAFRLQPRASRISRLTEASSRKSTLSANSETEPIASATANSTPK